VGHFVYKLVLQHERDAGTVPKMTLGAAESGTRSDAGISQLVSQHAIEHTLQQENRIGWREQRRVQDDPGAVAEVPLWRAPLCL
jgi:hypothetical protein